VTSTKTTTALSSLNSQELKSFTIQESDHFVVIRKAHPHIAQRIELMWGYVELHDYVMDLFMDTRDGQRRGFSEEVSKALMHLMHIHSDLFPHTVEKINDRYDVWCK